MKTDHETPSFEVGSGNVFADLELPDAPGLLLKSGLAGEINAILSERGVTQVEAARLLGVAQPKVSALKHGKLRGFSLEKLLDMLARLDRNVDIAVSAAEPGRGGRYQLTSLGHQGR